MNEEGPLESQTGSNHSSPVKGELKNPLGK